MDESISPIITEQLQRRAIDAVSVRDLGVLGGKDIDHLRRAVEMKRCIATADDDFVILVSQGAEHVGVIYAEEGRYLIGEWVKRL